MQFLWEDDDFSEGKDFLIEAAQLTLDIIRQQVERPVLTRRARINRDRLGAHALLVEDYFSENPKYPEHLFQRCVRMSRNLFSRSRLHPLGMRQLPNSMARSIPTRRPSRQSFMLEAVASQDLWIWHAFFGASGSNNDINVLNQSPIYNDLIEGMAPGQLFICNDTTYKYGYYLVDGIYPQWATFVKSFTTRQTEDDRRLYFQNRQEGARKDIERAFGVLKQKWHMIQHPARAWKPSRI
ncbi:hypothetical protein E3N88_24193 [Mikania micrantha]|uniref:DDE Tnp4 domain-containing protein n=1 Tax=Mikania micrantha TaxID=192012 RepID=A0A5N6NFF3_9ASTR|nr:hypothetical protein E3N88_24193 [Mikania micrantha]